MKIKPINPIAKVHENLKGAAIKIENKYHSITNIKQIWQKNGLELAMIEGLNFNKVFYGSKMMVEEEKQMAVNAGD